VPDKDLGPLSVRGASPESACFWWCQSQNSTRCTDRSDVVI